MVCMFGAWRRISNRPQEPFLMATMGYGPGWHSASTTQWGAGCFSEPVK